MQCQVSFSKFLKLVLTEAHGRGAQGGREDEVLIVCSQTSVASAPGGTRDHFSVCSDLLE